MKKETQEWITGIILGIVIAIVITLLMAVKVLAAPVEEVEISDEVKYWSEYYGDKYDIEPELIQAICWVESRCDNTAQSDNKRCKGLMQINPSFHQDRMDKLNVRNIFSISGNIKVGTDYLSELMQDDDVEVALAIFNGQSSEKVEKARKGEYGTYINEIIRVTEEIKRASHTAM